MPGESHAQRSLAGYSPWGHKESDTTERLTLSLSGVCAEPRCEGGRARRVSCQLQAHPHRQACRRKDRPFMHFPLSAGKSWSAEGPGETLPEEETSLSGSRLLPRQAPAADAASPVSQLPQPGGRSHVSWLQCGRMLRCQLVGAWQPARGLKQGTSPNTPAQEVSLVLQRILSSRF